MGSSDGYIKGAVKIVDHGEDPVRFNITLLGDGFRETELGQFAADAQAFADTLQATAPFTELWPAINIYRVDVVSNETGAADPVTCGDHSEGTGAKPLTYFDSTFCGAGGIRRLLVCDSLSARNVAQGQVPHTNLTMMLVNAREYGGSGGEVPTFSTDPQSSEIGLHEMGHTVFAFADEYDTWSGCQTAETDHNRAPAGEPQKPNITADASATIKWSSLLSSPADALPTTHNADCSICDPQGNPKQTSYVGAYEGAGYYHCGLYRAQYTCRMRQLGNPFCAVCQDTIRKALSGHMPAAAP
jgi:hypothetical protein